MDLLKSVGRKRILVYRKYFAVIAALLSIGNPFGHNPGFNQDLFQIRRVVYWHNAFLEILFIFLLHFSEHAIVFLLTNYLVYCLPLCLLSFFLYRTIPVTTISKTTPSDVTVIIQGDV